MRKTVNFTKVNAKAIGILNGKPECKELLPYIYNGRKLSKTALEKMYSVQLKESGLQALVFGTEEIQKTYEFSLEDLIAISTEVENTPQDGEEIEE